jgi:hypothetical protein
MPELDTDQQNKFVEELMTRNELKGGGKKRLIKFLGEKYEWDKHKVQFRLKRAIIAEKYAESH